MKGSEEQTTKSPKIAFLHAYKRDAWLQKFKKFNTAIPSLAAVERLFAVGSDILRSKRSSMTKENFEKFVLLRENEKCLKKSQFFSINNALFLNVSEWSFFCFGVYLFLLLLFIFIICFVLVFNCFFSTIKIILSSVLDMCL